MVGIPLAGVIIGIHSRDGVMWSVTDMNPGLDNKGILEIFEEIHEMVGIVLLVVGALDVVGALKHKGMEKDDTMKRMTLK